MTAQTQNNNAQVVKAEAKASSMPVPVSLSGSSGLNLDEMWRLATALSGSNLLPKAMCGKPNDVLVTILYGQELGLRPMQAIQGIYVVNGRPTIAGQLWLAKAREAGHEVKVTEHTAETCTVYIKRGDTGEDHTETFTMADAKTAKLDQKDTYRQHPKRMLLWRAISNACTFICPEIALGFGDEADREPVQSERLDQPTLGDVAAQRAETPEEPETQDAELVPDAEAQRAELLALAAEHEAPAVAVEDPPNLWDANDWPEVTPTGGKQ